ncbi:hypothetical protein ID866_2133 [Astraeus odoratus]|nr:hypothetical protein ID866_2133 [Astraeus odoratus]
MPVSSFFSQIADKAQNALNQTPLAAHLPGASSGGSDQPSANQAAAQGGHRSLALESLHYQIRSIGQQYTNATPVQRIITTEKGVALDLDSLARDAKAQSKELYTWGQEEDADLKDGSLASSLAVKLDNARSPLKTLRDAETAITPKRNARTALYNRIRKLEHTQDKTAERQLPELREQLARAEKNDEPQEKEILVLKRKAVRDSEKAKWDAIREYGEKLVLLSQAAQPIISALPTLPPTQNTPYTGASQTAGARAALQKALDHYQPGQITLPSLGADLSRSDTRSFGESHASELSSIGSTPAGEPQHPGLSITPPPTGSLQQTEKSSHSLPPINPSALNQSPATIPVRSSSNTAPTAVLAVEDSPKGTLPEVAPTVAETGVPLSAGPAGPGPLTGSLKDVRSGSQGSGTGEHVHTTSEDDLYASPKPQGETAEEEKKRLEREERERVLAASNVSQPKFESAEDEKKRLEREEQERVRAGGASSQGGNPGEPKDGDELPPYKDIEE